jgi:antitoxin component YwqK of YwqJK toxin-antitoxin module
MQGYKTGLVDKIKVLIVLYIPINAKTNINRENIRYTKYATYRTNKAYVLSIFDYKSNEYDSATSRFSNKKITYYKNTLAESEFNDNIECINTDGIHFFLDPEYALNYREHIQKQVWLEDINIYKNYFNNGQLHKKIKYYLNYNDKTINYKQIIEYYSNGHNRYEYNLLVNKLDGVYKEWYPNGVLKKRLTYSQNKIVSHIENWDIRGLKK